MSTPKSWFNQGSMSQLFQPGKVLHLSHPQEGKWRIDEIIKEYNKQRAQQHVKKDAPSYAAIKLSCSRADDPNFHAMMRVYIQIPYKNTELEEPKDRAKQAIEFKPKELQAFQILSNDSTTCDITPALLGYQESKQEASDIVQGGFLTIVVWQIVPGLRLADSSESQEPVGFWESGLDLEERNLIRAQFKETIQIMQKAGVEPDPFCVSNLVWHAESKTLFWIGFREWGSSTAQLPWSEFWWYYFKLAQVDGFENHPLDDEWDGDTSKWYW
ncbi:hypothetical protein N7493_008989 [Penicillium malachiteum]|uniref:Uncharacterized protein n=1 Tax=Penicillium malachiteum TaxID=1324776 RepID=A0AAD6HGA1_9EURO|nr:hypothetical protein N7493_008989 [Penicillium malachiteum]